MADSAIPSTAAPLVLVVDDHADTRDMCATMLALSGFRTAAATNGFEALAMAATLTPDCILMDLSLPGLDGREATRRLKADERTRGIPVVAVSGLSIGDGTGGGDKDFAAVLTKPCAPEAIVSALRQALARA